MRKAVIVSLSALLLSAASLPSPSAAAPSDAQRIALLEKQVQALQDREALRDLVMEYARSIDDRDWAAHKAIYADPLEVDYSSMPGAPGLMKVPVSAWVKQLQDFFSQVPATQHITDVLTIKIEGDTAHAITMLHAQHYMPNAMGEPIQRMIGTYDVWFVRTKQGWRISKIKPNLRWNEGNYWIFLKAANALPAK